MESFVTSVKFFSIRPKTMDYSPCFDFWSQKKKLITTCHIKSISIATERTLVEVNSTFYDLVTAANSFCVL